MSNSNSNYNTPLAHWIRDILDISRQSKHPILPLFESSIPEPTSFLSEIVRDTFATATPQNYKSVFSRNHPSLENWLASRYDIPNQHILCTSGASVAINFIMGAICKQGDHVVIENPCFDIFRSSAKNAGITYSSFERKAPEFEITLPDILDKLEANTKIVIISNPHNPSGAYTPLQDLQGLARELEKRQIYLLIDEVYLDYKEQFSNGLKVQEHPNIIRIGSLTKNYGLNTLRFGWIFAGSQTLIPIKNYVREHDMTTSKLSHAVAAQTLLRSNELDALRRDIVDTATPVMKRWLTKMSESNHIEMSTDLHSCICFPKLIGIENTVDFSYWLANNHNVAVIPGECFGAAGHIRIGYGCTPEILKEGLKRLSEGLIAFKENHSVSSAQSVREFNSQ
ncbi:pyridoxal phosphate-dependent aminotransferase [Hirschia baltica]|uniref:Aminotransferase class I and II n=1 Tax=Hirschia baltica (strain ATCC 49814 / DSM 5838 / IFAM 1418) TaxID=582402 RepID=C6XPS7_HIRBI|nr:pyridoxal phosphate-dependent aminotransferase [Hirschia baltica]ACT60342.1 aminotransferase class I and II [Hirschia baltica ATCC 49814]